MKRHAPMVLRLLVVVAAMLVGGGGSIAQEARPCAGPKDANCVEVLLRYHVQPQKTAYGESKVEILDPQTKKPLPICTLGKDCKDLHGQLDEVSLVLKQYKSNPHLCYRKCIGNWCTTSCPLH